MTTSTNPINPINSDNSTTLLEEAKTRLHNRLNSMSVETLKRLLHNMYSTIRKDDDIVFNALLNTLMGKIPEKEFTELMEKYYKN